MFARFMNTSSRWRLGSLLVVSLASLSLSACTAKKATSTPVATAPADANVRAFTLQAYLTGYKGVGGAIDGKVNPELDVHAGDKVEITVIDKETMAHDLTLEKAGVKTTTLTKPGAKDTVTFTAKANDTYFCSMPGHRQAGMEGKIVVTGAQAPKVASTAPARDGLFPHSTHTLKPAQPVTLDEISRDPSDIPAPIERRQNKTVEFTIKTKEVVAQIDDGTTYKLWTYNGKIPGPFLRVKQGDTVVIHLDNAPNSLMSHSIDFHAVTGPGGGAAVLQTPPGQRRTLKFKALHPGLFVYHCATPHIATHLAHGMFGMILVEPKQGLPKVDHEYYVMQAEYYTTAPAGTRGNQVDDDDRLLEEMPTYVVYNGRVGSLTGDRAMSAKVGQTVRLYFGVAGPDKPSAFHMIGEMFDRLYPNGSLEDPPEHGVQTTLVPPGDSAIAEFKVDYPGKYLLVDHALSRLDKGAMGVLKVTGPADPSIYQSMDGPTPAAH